MNIPARCQSLHLTFSGGYLSMLMSLSSLNKHQMDFSLVQVLEKAHSLLCNIFENNLLSFASPSPPTVTPTFDASPQPSSLSYQRPPKCNLWKCPWRPSGASWRRFFRSHTPTHKLYGEDSLSAKTKSAWALLMLVPHSSKQSHLLVYCFPSSFVNLGFLWHTLIRIRASFQHRMQHFSQEALNF